MNNKCRIIAVSVSLTLPNPLQAQDQNDHQEQDNSTAHEVIEVVAQKRKQNIQKVGISLTALSSKTLNQLGITDTVDITQQVPNLQLNTWSPNLTIFNLRGISQNSFTDNLEAPIAVYMDDGYVGSLNAVSGQLFDMKRVEILRGPQGTLFGRNATGGLIHYLSRLADEDYANGHFKVGAGSFEKQEIEAAYGNEIIENLRGRIAIRSDKSDGYIQSALSTGRAVGGTDNISLKTTLQWDITDDMQLDIIYKYSKDDDVPTGGYSFLPWTQDEINAGYMPPELMAFTQNVILDGGAPPNNLSLLAFTQNVFFNPDDGFTPVDGAGRTLFKGDHKQPHKHFSNIDGFLDRKVQNILTKVSWDIDTDVSFESITNFNTLDKTYLEDGDGIPAAIISFQTDMDYQQWSQELRLAGSAKKLKWQLGAYYLSMKHDGLATTVGNPVIRLANTLINSGELDANYNPGTGSPQAIQDYDINASNWSLFSQLEYSLNDELTMIAGLRWSQDDKKLHYVRGFQDLSANIRLIQQANVTPTDDPGKIDYQDYAGRLQLNWQMTADDLLFVSYNRGIKVGNWAFSAGVPVNELEHKPETLHSYEIGIKSKFAEPSVGLNLTGFYYNYKNYQAFAMLGLAPQIRNSDATVLGAELELFWQPNDAFELTFGAAYLNSEVEQVNAVAQWNSPVGGTVIDFPIDQLFDVELPNAPTFSFNYILKYQLPLLDGAITAQLDGVYYDEQYLEVTNGGGSYQKAYGISNLRLTYQPPQSRWSLNLWVKNLTDEVYKQYSLDLGMLGATAYYAQPRTTGASIFYRF